MGWNNVLECENDPFCQDILRYHFPEAKLYDDIRSLDGTEWRGRVDILTGGFPCQPFSAAGKRRGTDDNRFLWPEMLRLIQEIQPTWVVAENVRGIVSIDKGLVFEQVCSDLEANEYEVQPFCIPACAVNAPHRRDRIWFVANSKSQRNRRCPCKECGVAQRKLEQNKQEGSEVRSKGEGCTSKSDASNSKCERHKRKIDKEGQDARCDTRLQSWNRNWPEVATELCRMDDGLSLKLDGITFPKWRNESIKAYGNAIVPAVAYKIFQSIPI